MVLSAKLRNRRLATPCTNYGTAGENMESGVLFIAYEKETIEEFRFMLNYQYDSTSPMALVLVGQTELWEKLRLQRYAAVRQRIDINCVLPHLDRSESDRYILSHLVYAGGQKEIFTDQALQEIYKESTGIPRRINRICEKNLMYAYQQEHHLIDDRMVRFVIEHEMLGGK